MLYAYAALDLNNYKSAQCHLYFYLFIGLCVYCIKHYWTWKCRGTFTTAQNPHGYIYMVAAEAEHICDAIQLKHMLSFDSP